MFNITLLFANCLTIVALTVVLEVFLNNMNLYEFLNLTRFLNFILFNCVCKHPTNKALGMGRKRSLSQLVEMSTSKEFERKSKIGTSFTGQSHWRIRTLCRFSKTENQS